jgi:uncharacterized membrane protein YfcA
MRELSSFGDEESRPSDPHHTAGALALVWGWIVVLIGLLLLVVVPLLTKATEDGYCENIDHPGPCASVPHLLIPGAVVTAVGAWTMTASVAFRRRRRWGRPAVVVTFSLWALGALAGLVAEAVDHGDVDRDTMAVFVILLVLSATVTGLAGMPPAPD